MRLEVSRPTLFLVCAFSFASLVQAQDKPAEKFRVEITGGYGSGEFVPGEKVHIWSATNSESVSGHWSGDVELLTDSKEWATSFIMPGRHVKFQVTQKAVPVKFSFEKFKGSNSSLKEVYYHFPSKMRGMVFIVHGTGGGADFIEKTETRALALTLIDSGFGVVSADAEEVASGDRNNDAKTRWSLKLTESNVDLKNLQALLIDFEKRALIRQDTPKFALGMSNGGAFSVFLGGIAASVVAKDFDRLKFNAVVSYCADANSKSLRKTQTPTAWYMCGHENHPEVSNKEAHENHMRLKRRGVYSEYAEHPATPLYDERFSRLTDVSLQVSKLIVSEIRAAGLVDKNGFFNRNSSEVANFISANAEKFPTTVRLAKSTQRQLFQQIRVMSAEHALYSDFARRNVDFFEKFLPLQGEVKAGQSAR